MKKLFFILIFSFLYLLGSSSIAKDKVENEYPISFTINIPEARGPFLAAESAKNLKEKLRYYKLGAKYYEKLTDPKDEEIKTLTAIYNIIAGNLKEQKKYKDSFEYYVKAYENLKNANLHMNSGLGYLILQNIFFLGKDTNNSEYKKIAISAIETEQMELAYKHNSIYSFVAEYYDEIKEPSKAQMVRNKIVKKEVTIEFTNDFLKNLKYIVKEENLTNYLYPIVTSEDYSIRRDNYKLAFQYLRDMFPIPIYEIELLSALLIKMADEEMKFYNLKTASSLYKESFENLKKNDMHKDTKLAFYSLINLNYLGQILPDESLQDYAISNILNSQMEIIKENKNYYNEISKYYLKKGNLLKAGHYNNLFKQ